MARKLAVQFGADFGRCGSGLFYTIVAAKMMGLTGYRKTNLPFTLVGRDVFDAGFAACIRTSVVLVL